MTKTIRRAERPVSAPAVWPAAGPNNQQFLHVVAAREYLATVRRRKAVSVQSLCDELVRRDVLNEERSAQRLRQILRQKQQFTLLAGNGRKLTEVLPDIVRGHHAIAAGTVQDLARDGACHWVSRTGSPQEWTFAPGPGPDRPKAHRRLRLIAKADMPDVPGAMPAWNGLATGLRGLALRHPLADGTGPWSLPNCAPLGLTAEFVYATPALACCWWLLNVENNRDLIFSRVQHYAADMLQDRWVATNMSIGMTHDGQLFDGQNRLLAVWLSRVPTLMLVVWGLPATAMPAVDNNTPRDDADASRIAGGSLKSSEIAIGRAMLAGPITASRTVSRAARIAATEEFLPAIRLVVEHLNRTTCDVSNVAVAAAQAALARAVMTHPERRDDLVRFARLLAGGGSDAFDGTGTAARFSLPVGVSLVMPPLPAVNR